LLISWEGYYEEALPPQLEFECQSFFRRINLMYRGLTAERICCLDEIPLNFSPTCLKIPPGLISPQETEQRYTWLRKSSIKSCEATAILAMLLDGTLLPPMIIVKVSCTYIIRIASRA
jgi:hypothetical protein